MNILLSRALLAYALLFLSGPSFTQLEKIDVQGHRGFRGMYPENTIPAFQNAIDLGVNTLEMDIVLSGENTWFVSHEPWLNHTICKDIQGRIIKADHEQTYNHYWLTDLEIKACDCGSLKNPDFPDQLKFNVSKPTLKEFLDFCEKHASEKGVEIRYSIEIKSDPEWEGIYQPGLDEYVDFLTDFMDWISFIDRIVIQSFDERILRAIHDQRPTWKLAYLVSNFRSVQNNIDFMGFKPSVYSPN